MYSKTHLARPLLTLTLAFHMGCSSTSETDTSSVGEQIPTREDDDDSETGPSDSAEASSESEHPTQSGESTPSNQDSDDESSTSAGDDEGGELPPCDADFDDQTQGRVLWHRTDFPVDGFSESIVLGIASRQDHVHVVVAGSQRSTVAPNGLVIHTLANTGETLAEVPLEQPRWALAHDIQELSDGSIILHGRGSESRSGRTGIMRSDLLTARYTPTGELEWLHVYQQDYRKSPQHPGTSLPKIAITAEDQIVIATTASVEGSSDTGARPAYYILSAAGDETLRVVHDPPNDTSTYHPFGVAQSTSSSPTLLLTGYPHRLNTFDSAGKLSRTIDVPEMEHIAISHDGRIAMAGTLPNHPKSSQDTSAIRVLGPEFTMMWVYEGVRPLGAKSAKVAGIQFDADQNVLIANIMSGCRDEEEPKLYVAKYGNGGARAWGRVLDCGTKNQPFCRINGTAIGDNGEFYIAGTYGGIAGTPFTGFVVAVGP